jgi:hypothetical protein
VDPDPAALARVDLLWAAGSALGAIDLVRGTHFQTRHVLAALDCGDPYRISRALSAEAVFLAGSARDRPRAAEAIATGRRLAAESGDPRALAFAEIGEGWSAMQEGRWRAGLEACDRGMAIFRHECPAMRWEMVTAELVSCWCLGYLGELAELARRHALLGAEAEARDDGYALTNIQIGVNGLARLAADEPDAAAASIEVAMSRWPARGFLVQHLFALHARAEIDLYRGRPEEALELLERDWPQVVRSRLTAYNQYLQILMHECRARAALAVAARASGGARASRLALARRDLRILERQRIAWAAPGIALLRAGLAHVEGDRARSTDELEGALAAAIRCEMSLHAAAARAALGDEATAHAALEREGARRPAALARLYAPWR